MPPPRQEYDPVEMLDRLVAFPTISGTANRALIDWVAGYLGAHGVATHVLPAPVGDQANLYATIGPVDRAGGVVLSGHTDVVPVADQSWNSDPFRLTERDGRLIARGAADMKGFLAVALAMVPEFAARPLKTPIHLALTFDEEIGCLGVPHLIRHVAAHLPRPALVIVGEPTGMRPCAAHKGIVVCRTTVEGNDGHSSQPLGTANAIRYASEIVGFLYRLADELADAPDPAGLFDPPHATLNVGTIAGGTALNIVARHCAVVWEMRPVDDGQPAAVRARLDRFVAEHVLPRLQAEHPTGSVDTEVLCAVPPLRPDPDGPAETLVRWLTGLNVAGSVPFATEAGVYQGEGISAVVMGPGDIAVAHQPNEYTTRDQLEACRTFLRRLADWAEQ